MVMVEGCNIYRLVSIQIEVQICTSFSIGKMLGFTKRQVLSVHNVALWIPCNSDVEVITWLLLAEWHVNPSPDQSIGLFRWNHGMWWIWYHSCMKRTEKICMMGICVAANMKSQFLLYIEFYHIDNTKWCGSLWNQRECDMIKIVVIDGDISSRICKQAFDRSKLRQCNIILLHWCGMVDSNDTI